MRKFLLVLIILLMSVSFIGVQALEYNIPVSVTVLPIYELSIDINILNNKLSSGENLSIFIELEKTDLTSISEEIAVDLNYEITRKKKKSKIIKSGFLKTVNIAEYKEEIINIKIPSDLKGSYNLKIIASNPQSYSDEDKERFWVRKKSRFTFPFYWMFRL